MDTINLGKILRKMYTEAPRGEQVTNIHLFGIKYSKEISNLSIKEIVQEAGIPLTYVTEVTKGVNLAKYVTIK